MKYLFGLLIITLLFFGCVWSPLSDGDAKPEEATTPDEPTVVPKQNITNETEQNKTTEVVPEPTPPAPKPPEPTVPADSGCSKITNCADCINSGCNWCIQGSVCAESGTADKCFGGWMVESYQCHYASR
jgi:hypothetical protein